VILILRQNRLRWCGHVLQGDTGWVRRCVKCGMAGSGPGGRPGGAWREVVRNGCQARNLNKDDAVDRGGWKRLIKIG